MPLMSHLPVSCSTLSASHLAPLLQHRYALGPGTSCRLLKTGINHSYLVSNGTAQYIFRVYSLDWRSAKEIAEELRLLNLLKENGVAVSYPIADVHAAYIQPLDAPEGSRPGVLFSFAPGEKAFQYPAETHYAIGVQMARMHSLTHHLRLERIHYDEQVLLVQPLLLIKHFLPQGTPELLYMEQLQAYLLQIWPQMNRSAMRPGVVHLDIWFDNLHIGKNGQVTFFDFDFCGNGWLCYDMAYYLMQLYNTEKDPEEHAAKKESFLKGYTSVTPFSEEESRWLPAIGLALYFFYLGVQCYRYENWSNVFLNEVYLKRYINLVVKKWADLHGLPAAPQAVTGS